MHLSALLQLHFHSRLDIWLQGGKDSRKTVRESFTSRDSVRLILETGRYLGSDLLLIGNHGLLWRFGFGYILSIKRWFSNHYFNYIPPSSLCFVYPYYKLIINYVLTNNQSCPKIHDCFLCFILNEAMATICRFHGGSGPVHGNNIQLGLSIGNRSRFWFNKLSEHFTHTHISQVSS